MEDEDDDFGELYYDVLKPFLLPSHEIKNAEQKPADEKLESFSTSSANIGCTINNGGGLHIMKKGREVVGTVRLEIYLGSRRVLENKFVFPLGGQEVGQTENDSGFNQSGNLGTDDGGNEMSSIKGLVNYSHSERSKKIAACDGRVGAVEVGNSNSDPDPDGIRCGKALGTPDGGINKRIDGTPSVQTQEPCKGEPSEEGQLSEYAEMESADIEMVTINKAATSNSVEEARISYNKVHYSPYKSPLKDVRHVAATPYGQAAVPHHMITTKPYRHPPKPRFPDMSTSLYDLDLDSLEQRPWRRPNADISGYFNFGLDETSWRKYCEEIRTMRMFPAKPIQFEHGVRDHLPILKAMPQWQQDSTSTIHIVTQDKPLAFGKKEQIKCYRQPELEQNGDGSIRSQQGNQSIHHTIFAGMKDEQAGDTKQYSHGEDSKRAKTMEETGRDSSSNMSENEWMCRHVGMDSWFHPISVPEQDKNRHHEANRKGSRKGRSKLERWTRHDRDNDDENTSTSSLSSPLGFSNAGIDVGLED